MKAKVMIQKARVLAVLVIAVLCFSVSAASGAIKTVIVDGQNNHDWKATTSAMTVMLEQTGLFTVDVATSPGKSDAMDNFKPAFDSYDLVVLNYNGKDWPKATQDAFVRYVRSGGGVVVVHAADNSFGKWKEYNEIIGVGGWGGRNEKSGPYIYWRDGKIIRDNSPGRGGTHGPQRAYQVTNRVTNHPITKGLPGKWMHGPDELYARLRGPAKNLTVLSTALSAKSKVNEPVLMTISYGKGRIFHTVLGHGAPQMESVGFIVTFQRGCQWAATGQVTQEIPTDFPTATEGYKWAGHKQPSLEKLLDKVATYDYGTSRIALSEISDSLRKYSNSPKTLKHFAKQLVKFLQRPDTTFAGKQFVCRKLSIIGTEQAVPTLAAMLTDSKTSDMARYALQRIDGQDVDKALRDALQRSSGKARVGIINSIGRRADTSAAKALVGLIYDSDPDTASAAVAALLEIGGPVATKALGKAEKKTSGKLKMQVSDAYLECADKLMDEGKTKTANRIYEKMSKPDKPLPIRMAALQGKIKSDPKNACKVVIEAITGDEPLMRRTAIGLINDIPGAKMTKAITKELPKLSAEVQVPLILTLAYRGDPAALPAVIQSAKSGEVEVRIAALKAIGMLGNASNVMLLTEKAADNAAKESDAARQSLYSLRGPKVNETILENINSAKPALKVELLRSITKRNIATAAPVLLKTTRDADSKVRSEAIKALRGLAGPKDMPTLINLLTGAVSDAQRREAEKTIVAIARKIDDKDLQLKALLARLGSVKDVAARCSLMSVLGQIGNSKALPVLRVALKDKTEKVRDTAVRVLSQWPNDEPIPDLREIAKNDSNSKRRILALRSYIKMVAAPSERDTAEKVKLLADAMAIAERAEEKKAVLAVLPRFSCTETLNLAKSCIEDTSLKAEAELAVKRINEAMSR